MLLALIIAASPVVDVTLFPFTSQVNGTLTQQFAHAGSVSWRAGEGFGLVATAYVMNPLSGVSGLNSELTEKIRAGLRALPMFTTSYFGLGTELRPMFGSIGEVHLELLLSAGVGAASTRIELKPRNDAGPATFGDTGWRPGFAFGAGLRARFTHHVALHVELRDFAISSGNSNVNGCSPNDLKNLYTWSQFVGYGAPPVGAGCRADSFMGVEDFGDVDQSNDRRRADDLPLAYSASKTPRAELLHNVQLLLGLTISF